MRGEEYVRDCMWQAKIKNIYLIWPFTEEISWSLLLPIQEAIENKQ